LQIVDRESRTRTEINGSAKGNDYRNGMLVLRIRDAGTAYGLPRSGLWTCRRSDQYIVRHIVHKLVVDHQSCLHVSRAIVSLNHLEAYRAVVVAAGWNVDVLQREPPLPSWRVVPIA